MALTPRNGGPDSPTDDIGRTGGRSPTDRRWRERRKTTRLYHKWDVLRPSGHLPGSARLRDIAANGLCDYCVSGRFEGPDMEPAIECVGDCFSPRLDATLGDFGDEHYPASVLMGKFMQLGIALHTKPHPLFDHGGFATPEARRVLYRLVILPFAEDARSVDRWLALGCWRIELDAGEMPFTE